MALNMLVLEWPVVRCVFTSCFDMLASIMRPYRFVLGVGSMSLSVSVVIVRFFLGSWFLVA